MLISISVVIHSLIITLSKRGRRNQGGQYESIDDKWCCFEDAWLGSLKGILSHIFASSGESIHRFMAVYLWVFIISCAWHYKWDIGIRSAPYCWAYFYETNFTLWRARLSRLRMIWLLAHPLPPTPFPFSKLDRCHTGRDWERETVCWRKRVVGEKPN